MFRLIMYCSWILYNMSKSRYINYRTYMFCMVLHISKCVLTNKTVLYNKITNMSFHKQKIYKQICFVNESYIICVKVHTSTTEVLCFVWCYILKKLENIKTQLIEMFSCQNSTKNHIMLGTDHWIAIHPLTMRVGEDQIEQSKFSNY